MPYKDPEAKKEWRRRNSKEISAYTKAWKERNPDRHAAMVQRHLAKKAEESRAYRAAHPFVTKIAGYAKRHRLKIRAEGMKALGGRCVHCGFGDERALQFDHKRPLLRRSSGRDRRDSTHEVRNALRSGTIREVFQLLCANCHVIKTREGGEYSMRADEPASLAPQAPSPMPLLAGVGPIPR